MTKCIYEQEKVEVTFNMTPMIDCTFQLIIFFMLVTQMVSADYVDMKLPVPSGKNIGKELDEMNRVVVNVVPFTPTQIEAYPAREGMCNGYKCGRTDIPKGPDTEAGIKDILLLANAYSEERDLPGEFVVIIRADRSTRYIELLPVLRAVQKAKIEKMRITVGVKGRG